MPDLEKLHNTKEKLLSIIREKGPSFPARIAREMGLSPLFTAAFLSELVAEKRLKISSMKVGSSPIYFLNGQETKLEDFAQYLNHKEREAMLKLKEEKILADDSQEPAIRVALRKIRDFAFPINVRIDNETKVFWYFFAIPEEEAKRRIESLITGTPFQPVMQPTPFVSQSPLTQQVQQINQPVQPVSPQIPVQKPDNQEERPLEQKIKKKPKKDKSSKFSDDLKEYLEAKDIEILQEIPGKGKEFTAKVRIDTIFGKQEYYLIAKDKKKVSEEDLTMAVHKANTEKMPALVLAPGELDKNARDFAREWRNLVKFEALKF